MRISAAKARCQPAGAARSSDPDTSAACSLGESVLGSVALVLIFALERVVEKLLFEIGWKRLPVGGAALRKVPTTEKMGHPLELRDGIRIQPSPLVGHEVIVSTLRFFEMRPVCT